MASSISKSGMVERTPTGGGGITGADPMSQPALANAGLVGRVGHSPGGTFQSMAPGGIAQPPAGSRPAVAAGGSRRPGFGVAPVGGSTARIRAQRAQRAGAPGGQGGPADQGVSMPFSGRMF